MHPDWQIPRNALLWLLLAQLFVVAPHMSRLPFWVLSVYIICVIWRGLIFYGRASFVSRSVKVALLILSFSGIAYSYRSAFGLEPSVALLVTGFSLKLIEAKLKRDTFVLIFLAYFVAVTEFLFDQSLLISIYMFFSVLMVTSALLALYESFYEGFNFSGLKKTVVMFAQATPLMMVLFVIFPRFEPLWRVPMPSHQANSGVSDTLSPGDISQLSKSDKLAFRVSFQGDVPPLSTLYWRGLVLSDFDGRRWTQDDQRKKFYFSKKSANEKIVDGKQAMTAYTIIQEPTYQPWLFALRLASSSTDGVVATRDFNLRYKTDIYDRLAYDVNSSIEASLGSDLSNNDRREQALLVANKNQQSVAFAKQLYSQVSNNQDYINKVFQLFRTEPFYYSLTPPLLGENSVDDFLFNTRRGFCGHYASSFTFMMRAVGIPARIVTGYLGGEVNPLTGALLVYQYDAHAWSEVWLEGRGWVRFDPTLFIAPERIESRLQNINSDAGVLSSRSPLSPLRLRQIRWINDLRMRMDALEYSWARWVLNYGGEQQLSFIVRLLGEVSALRLMGLFLVVIALLVVWVFFDVLKAWLLSNEPIEQKLYKDLCKQLALLGYERAEGEGVIDFSRRVMTSGLDETARQAFLSVTRLFVSLNYEPMSDAKQKLLLMQFRQEVKQCRQSLSP